jgi:hypothetical protein
MAGFDNDVCYANNIDFSGGSPVSGKMLLDGQLLIGSTALNAGGTHLNVNTLTAGSGIAITNGAGTITISNTGGGGGGGGATSLSGNTGSAPNIAGVINVIGSTGLTTTGDGIQTLTITPTGNLLALHGLSGTGYVVRTGSNTFIERTFLAGSGILLSNADGVAGATTITAGATVPTTFTEDTGSATPAANNINILGTSAQGISTSGAGATVTITAANATSIQKGVASFNATNFTVTAGAVASNAITVTAGTGLTTGGVVNLGGSVTLALDIPVTVAHGGTGDITLTNHGVMLGQGTSPVVVTAAGTNGQVLIGGTGVDPAFATIAGTQGVTLTGGSNTLSIGLVNVPNSALANSSITINAGSGISVVGSPVSLGGAVTISASGTIVTQFSSDSGTATPSGNNINLVGTAAQGLTTSATGSTVTFTNTDWSIIQKGVGALATNAETIAGTVSNKAVSPSTLAAKLGTQTAHGVAIFEGTSSALVPVGPNAASGIPLISQGAASDPIFGTAIVPGGGTGATSFTAYSVITGGTSSTGALQNVSGVGTSGQVLTSNGAGTLPTWQGVSISTQPSFNAYLVPTLSNVTGDNTGYVIPFTNVIANNGSGWNGNTTFTAPSTGIYIFGHNISVSGLTASHTYGAFYMITTSKTNTSPAVNPYAVRATIGGVLNLPYSGMFSMTAGDTMTLTIVVDGGTKVVDLVNGNIWGFKIV